MLSEYNSSGIREGAIPKGSPIGSLSETLSMRVPFLSSVPEEAALRA